MHLVNLVVQLRRNYNPRQTSVRTARDREGLNRDRQRPLFGAEFVDDFRTYTRRIDLLFAAMPSRVIVAVN